LDTLRDSRNATDALIASNDDLAAGSRVARLRRMGGLLIRQLPETSGQAPTAAARQRDARLAAARADSLAHLVQASTAAQKFLLGVPARVRTPVAARPVHTARPTCDGRRATIVGTEGPDVIDGTPGRDVIVGLGGDDQISGRGQNDIICAGDGNDLVFGNGGNDTLVGGAGNDFLDGGAGDDAMDAGGDRFDAIAFFDETGPVTASLATGTASGDGNDTFSGAEQLFGGDFADTFTGDGGDNGLFGNGGNDTLSGGAGNDNLNGGAGNDSLFGEAGNDFLDGADGVDFLDGGPDFDICANGESVINCET
jgi:Ca2+-binding RTX toxin-like protein